MFLLSLLLLQLLSLTPERLSHLEMLIREVPPTVEHSVQTLGGYLSEQTDDELEKAFLLYQWVASNIRYDVRAYQTLSSSSRGTDVLTSRKAVCQGYSELVNLIAKEMGLKSKLIAGHTRSSDPSIPNFSTRTSHAWNAIYIKERWILLDATWGSGYLDHKTGAFKPEVIPFYFNTPPERFIADHYPDDPTWQLILPIVSKSEFEQFPKLRSTFFSIGLQLYSHTRSPIKVEEDVTIAFLGSPKIRILAELRDDSNMIIENATLVQRLDSVIFVSARPPKTGKIELVIYANSNPESNRFTEVVSYDLIAQKGNKHQFPTLYAGFSKNDTFLHKPLVKDLPLGKTETFELNSTEYKRLYLVHQNTWKRFDKDGFAFRLYWETKRGLIQIVASKELNSSSAFEVLMEYYVP